MTKGKKGAATEAQTDIEPGYGGKNVIELGGNIKPTLERILKARDKVIALKGKRAEINADIAAERAAVEALGVSKKAFDDALKYYEADPEQREGYDTAYAIAREAMGFKVKPQLDLFENPENDGGDIANTEKPLGVQQAEAIQAAAAAAADAAAAAE